MRAENRLEFDLGVDLRNFKLLPFVMGNEAAKNPALHSPLVAKQIDSKIERYRFGAARKA